MILRPFKKIKEQEDIIKNLLNDIIKIDKSLEEDRKKKEKE